MLNGLIIGLTGTVIGIPLGYTFLWLIENYWTFDQTVYYISHIPVHVRAVDVVLVSVLGDPNQFCGHAVSVVSSGEVGSGRRTPLRVTGCERLMIAV